AISELCLSNGAVPFRRTRAAADAEGEGGDERGARGRRDSPGMDAYGKQQRAGSGRDQKSGPPGDVQDPTPDPEDHRETHERPRLPAPPEHVQPRPADRDDREHASDPTPDPWNVSWV